MNLGHRHSSRTVTLSAKWENTTARMTRSDIVETGDSDHQCRYAVLETGAETVSRVRGRDPVTRWLSLIEIRKMVFLTYVRVKNTFHNKQKLVP